LLANLHYCVLTQSHIQTIDKLIETGDGEQIFQRAIQEQGRGRVLILSAYVTARISAWMLTKLDGKFLSFVGTGHTAGDPGAP
jgi:hypothetical protein